MKIENQNLTKTDFKNPVTRGFTDQNKPTLHAASANLRLHTCVCTPVSRRLLLPLVDAGSFPERGN